MSNKKHFKKNIYLQEGSNGLILLSLAMFQKPTLYIIYLLFYAFISNAQTQLTVRSFAEGFYRPATGKMVAVVDPVNSPLICDTADIALLNDTNYSTEYCARVVINTDGYGVCTIPSSLNGRSFIVGLKYRNTLHLYSNTSKLINGQPVLVDLTDPINCSGNPVVILGFAMAASGEISSAALGIDYYDGILEVQDLADLENSIYFQDTGYVITDLTGDGIVDSLDYYIELNNTNSTLVDYYISDCSLLTTSILETEKEVFHLFPNPAVSNFSIHFNHLYASLKIEMFNSTGQLVFSRNYENEQEVKIDCSRIENGLYYFLINNDEIKVSGKIMLLNSF